MDGLHCEAFSVRIRCKGVATSQQLVSVRASLVEDSRRNGKDDWVQVTQWSTVVVFAV